MAEPIQSEELGLQVEERLRSCKVQKSGWKSILGMHLPLSTDYP